jgi:hypothetical protein
MILDLEKQGETNPINNQGEKPKLLLIRRLIAYRLIFF